MIKFPRTWNESSYFFEANGIADEKKVPVLMSVIGAQTYALLSDLLAPDKPTSKTVEQLKEVLQKHYELKPVVIAERFSVSSQESNAKRDSG